MPKRLGSTTSLSRQLAAELRRRLLKREWQAGDRLPAEHALAAEYGVSRPTVRAALLRLESEGLLRTRHGVGTIALPIGPEVRAGAQELRSMTETIAEQGHQPGMHYRTRCIRPATPEEAEKLDIEAGIPVLVTERSVTSDGTVVAFSYDCIPAAFLPGVAPEQVTGSLFALLDEHGWLPDRAVAELHAVRSNDVGWPRVERLYLLLDQVHFVHTTAVAWSRTYFIEGRYQFTLLRLA